MHPLQILTPPNSNGGAAGVVDAPSHARIYRVWKGSNEFFLRGRLIFGPDVKYTFITIFLIVAPIAIFSVFVAKKLDNLPPNSGYSILITVILHTVFVLITLLLTSARDPGILPRNDHPPEPDEYDECANIFPEQSPQPHLPLTKDVIVNGISLKIKYCHTCMLYRPPRCYHCSVCDNCVERFDHHCPWVGQCIGLSTYENIKNLYDRQVNPFNKGVVYNCKEIFCSTIPPSKNNFRSKVTIPKEPSDSCQRKGFESLRSLMRKTRGEMEMGKQVYNEYYEEQNDSRDGFTNKDEVGCGSGFSDISVDLIKMLHMEGGEREVASFLRDNLWERSSRRRNISHKIGESMRSIIDSETGSATDSTIDSATARATDGSTHSATHIATDSSTTIAADSATHSATDIASHSATHIATTIAADSATTCATTSATDSTIDIATSTATDTATHSATHIAIDSSSGPSGDLTKVVHNT
ncbi:unnamed protein product [Lupinus luteus]|uniref:S-acyltransferase n=1 Tax=Lupinus luteus TaxID=3873 RepID=A0AAV1Y3Q5_LUPLU